MNTRLIIPVLALISIVIGAVNHYVWTLGVILLGAPIVFQTIRNALKGRFATDVVATLSIVGSVALDQPLAGLVIVLMQSGGEALERYAEGRASAAVRALEEEAPRIAHRYMPGEAPVVGGATDDVGVAAVVVAGASHVDASRLTGEALPVRTKVGSTLASGSLNLDGALIVRATATAG